MKRLTSEEVRVDESVDRYLGPLADLEGMKPKLLDLILNGPVLNGVSKDVLRQIIRQLYSALAAYEDTGITAEEITATASLPMFVKVASAALGTTPDHLRELVDADKEGRTVTAPYCKNCEYGEAYDRMDGKREYIATARARSSITETAAFSRPCGKILIFAVTASRRRADGWCRYIAIGAGGSLRG